MNDINYKDQTVDNLHPSYEAVKSVMSFILFPSIKAQL